MTGRCEKIESCNAKTGETRARFLDYAKEESVTVCGISGAMKKGLEYELEGKAEEDGTFAFSKIIPYADRGGTLNLLESVSFNKEKAALFADAAEECGNPYGFVESMEWEEKLRLLGFNDDDINAVSGLFCRKDEKNEAWLFLKKQGVPETGILSLFKKNPGITVEKILEDPYGTCKYGMPLANAEEIALKNGMDPWDFRRVEAILRDAAEQNEADGHTRIPKAGLIAAAVRTSRKSGGSKIPKEIFEIVACASDNYKVYGDGSKEYVSKKHTYLAETSIARNVRRICGSRKRSVRTAVEMAGAAQKVTGFKYNEGQLSVFPAIERGGMSVLLGGPGTGKTTVISGIVRAFEELFPDKKILLCAPTGRAAARMGELSSHKAMTMHKSLNLKVYGDRVNKDPLPYDLIIADEMSMCDTDLAAMFFESVVSGTTVLLSGDYEQIPSVGPGQVLRDLVESGSVPVYRLIEIIRQQGRNLIIPNAQHILDGKPLEEGPDFTLVGLPSDKAIIKMIEEMDKEAVPQVLCPVKHKKAGTFELNSIIQRKQGWTDKGININGTVFHVGDKVIMNSNNYEAGYMNGDVGEITSMQFGELEIRFAEKTLKLVPSDADGMLLAYAVTFHKSQGSECDEVLIILPEGAKGMASRELLRTAITRAKKKVTVIYAKDTLDEYLAAAGRSVRDCGLKGFLGRK